VNGAGKGSGRNLTLEEIGQRAGVSRSTVSRVLNDHPDVRPTVRQRVEAVIQETGYEPNPAARALVSRRTGLIGLVMFIEVDELFGDPYYSALVTGIQQGCLDHDLKFAIFPLRATEDGPDAVTPRIADGFVDGVIVTAGPRSDRLISALRDRGTQMVVVGHPADDEGLTRVDVENRVGSLAAVAHLCDHGHRRVGFIGPTPDHRYGVERLDGYRDAIIAAGHDVDDDLIRLEEPSEQGGYRATTELLSAHPDAIFASTDPMAEGAYRALTDHDLRVPEDIAVVGFDGLPRGPQLEPALTTVIQPVAEVGRAAVSLLARDDDQPDVVVLPTTLRFARSCDADGLHAPTEPSGLAAVESTNPRDAG
jgi:LacI family transcriptional regulator